MRDTAQLGQLIIGRPQRDAIHVAIAPTVAGSDLSPGQHVGLEHGKASARAEKLVGIVDPFLEVGPSKGQSFWLVLYPGTITSLRHDWTHPAFALSESEEWLRKFCDTYGACYDEMVEGAVQGRGYCFGDDAGPEYAREGEFWRHVEAVTGQEFDDEHRSNTYFRCAC